MTQTPGSERSWVSIPGMSSDAPSLRRSEAASPQHRRDQHYPVIRPLGPPQFGEWRPGACRAVWQGQPGPTITSDAGDRSDPRDGSGDGWF